MGGWISFNRDTDPTDQVVQYCKSVVFTQFYGQTTELDGRTDGRPIPDDATFWSLAWQFFRRSLSDEQNKQTNYEPKTHLGIILSKMDEEIRRVSSDQFEITQPMKDMLKELAELRVCTGDCESIDECHQRLLEDADTFKHFYRKRTSGVEKGHSEVLEGKHSFYWGTRQQLLFGKVVCDWLACRTESKNPMDPVFGALLNPTGGRVGPGDDTVLHNLTFDNMGAMAYHAAVHDAFGYLKNNHNLGPGYAYLNQGLFGDGSPFGGQLFGILFWKGICKELRPLNALNEQFIFK
ncbi:uncharacterized protein [Clytia hemisphaerica]|uniref:Uncharacterized protein n=1 Tax=Clytia hemisphaerica TaxID=252671 RepID=A0A7M5XG27_9CNID